EPDFERLFGANTTYLGGDHGPQQQRTESSLRRRSRLDKRNLQKFLRSHHRMTKQRNKRRAGNRLLVTRDGQPSLADVEGSAGCSPVAARIVQHAVADTIRRQVLVVERVTMDRQRQLSRQSM